MTNPILDLIDLVVADVDASVAFYRAVGIDIPEATVWRTATGAHHVDIDLPGGLGLHLDSASLAKAYNEGWSDPDAKAGRVVLGFRQPDRNAVDRLYADLTALGYRGSQSPYDTF
jgi:catechol 2,3-dioxygenase-like lactoylglutathione lyase family enzyme